jgi:hypothetical protein
MIVKKTFLLFSFLMIVITAQAQAEKDSIYGISPTYSSATISDPDGATSRSSSISVLGFNSRHKASFKRYTYWISEIHYDQFSFDASENNIGQEATKWNFGGGLETRVAVSRGLDFYVGAIVGVSQVEAASRFTVFADGFLDKKFEKRSESMPYVKFRAAYYTRILGAHYIAITPSYEMASGDGFSSFNLSATYFF